MRRISWGLALLVVVVLASQVAAECPQCERYKGYGAAPCSAGGMLQPGCCDCKPTACDNAWDGFCEEKARRSAFWTRVGTGSGGTGGIGGFGVFGGFGAIGWCVVLQARHGGERQLQCRRRQGRGRHALRRRPLKALRATAQLCVPRSGLWGN